MAVKVAKTSEEFMNQVKEMGKDAMMLVAYKKDSAEPAIVGPGAGGSFGGTGQGPLSIEAAKKLVEDKDYIEIKTLSVIRAWRNPTCIQIQLPSGEWICISG